MTTRKILWKFIPTGHSWPQDDSTISDSWSVSWSMSPSVKGPSVTMWHSFLLRRTLWDDWSNLTSLLKHRKQKELTLKLQAFPRLLCVVQLSAAKEKALHLLRSAKGLQHLPSPSAASYNAVAGACDRGLPSGICPWSFWVARLTEAGPVCPHNLTHSLDLSSWVCTWVLMSLLPIGKFSENRGINSEYLQSSSLVNQMWVQSVLLGLVYGLVTFSDTRNAALTRFACPNFQYYATWQHPWRMP